MAHTFVWLCVFVRYLLPYIYGLESASRNNDILIMITDNRELYSFSIHAHWEQCHRHHNQRVAAKGFEACVLVCVGAAYNEYNVCARIGIERGAQ